eukprot:1184252-Prorocentrum_minimum.AAC.1
MGCSPRVNKLYTFPLSAPWDNSNNNNPTWWSSGEIRTLSKAIFSMGIAILAQQTSPAEIPAPSMACTAPTSTTNTYY